MVPQGPAHLHSTLVVDHLAYQLLARFVGMSTEIKALKIQLLLVPLLLTSLGTEETQPEVFIPAPVSRAT